MVGFEMLVHFIGGLLLFGLSCAAIVKNWSAGYSGRITISVIMVLGVMFIWVGMDIYSGRFSSHDIQWEIMILK